MIVIALFFLQQGDNAHQGDPGFPVDASEEV